MFLLGLIAAICFVPGYTGASIPTQWALFSAVLPFFLWRAGQWTTQHWLGLAALAYAAVSIAWAPSIFNGLWGLWLFGIWALAFYLGTTNSDIPALFRGLATGLGVSSAIAIAQHYGFTGILYQADRPPAGLLFNSTMLGAVCALVALALIPLGEWRWLPALAPALILSQSRGAWLILAVGLLARKVPTLLLLAALAISSLILLGFPLLNSDSERLQVWGQALQHLSWPGNGLGSFTSFYYVDPYNWGRTEPRLVHPEFVHFDALHLLFELGPGALPIYALFGYALTQTYHTLWPALLGFVLLGCFYFPLYAPLPALVGCILAGRLCADRAVARSLGYHWRPDLLLWHPIGVAVSDPPRGLAVPAQPRT